MAAQIPTEEEVLSYFSDLQWGRWGDDVMLWYHPTDNP